MVFRKDYYSAQGEPATSCWTADKRYVVGAGINTRDYAERVPALVEAGRGRAVHRLLRGLYRVAEAHARLDPRTLRRHGEGRRGQRGGPRRASASWPRRARTSSRSASAAAPSASRARPKGIGRGQATALIEVAKARDEYFQETGIYVPICSDGGIVHDYHMTLALAMGADFVMLGRYFARFDESPTNKVNINGNYMKEYWGEGSNRARNWQRYDLGGAARALLRGRRGLLRALRRQPEGQRGHLPCTRCAPPCATAARSTSRTCRRTRG